MGEGAVVRRLVTTADVQPSNPVHLPRLLRHYVHAFAHSHHNIVPIPLWRRVPPGAQNELKEEEKLSPRGRSVGRTVLIFTILKSLSVSTSSPFKSLRPASPQLYHINSQIDYSVTLPEGHRIVDLGVDVC